MNKLTFISSSLFILFLCTACPEQIDPADSELTIKNNSNDSIVYYFELLAPNDTLLTDIAYPQTKENIQSRIIPPNNETTNSEGFRRVFDGNSDKVLMIYIFSPSVINTVPWDSIVSNYQILRRYDLTLDDLEAMSWTVEYP